ncbi:MAG: EAL domain-containing protein [Pseudomonadota bacterium]
MNSYESVAPVSDDMATDLRLTEPLRVLLVEDNRFDYDLTRRHLADFTRPGYRLDWAATFDDAVAAIRDKAYDAFLFDHRLADASGLELLQVTRDMDVRAPVIFLTGLDDEHVDREALSAGASDYLVKSELTPGLLDRSIRYAIERENLLHELEYAAHRDALTGLANRRHFLSHLRDALLRAERTDLVVGLLLIDLDHFKEVNDRFGHEAGDQVLCEVARLIKERVRSVDLVARLGGDEFSVVLEGMNAPENAQMVANDIVAMLRVRNLHVGDEQVSVGASIGLAFSGEEMRDVATLMRAADTAMYEAKRNGRSRQQLFRSEMQRAAMKRAEIHQALPGAVAGGELRLHFQPQYSVSEQRVIAAEALVRWQTGDRLLSPGEFIPIAEEGEIIHELGAWVIREACRQLGRWQADGIVRPEFVLTLNLSAKQLVKPTVVDIVRAALTVNQLRPESIELEITESAAMRESDMVHRTLMGLRELGVRIALDDFGTGFSSLSYLSRVPVDTIKIDRSFVQFCEDNAEHATLVRGTLGFANSLGLSVVAEGVETPGQRDFLRSNGCDVMQGYLFQRPCSADDFERALSGDVGHAA